MKRLIINRKEFKIDKPNEYSWYDYPSLSSTSNRFEREFIEREPALPEHERELLFDWISSSGYGVFYTCPKYFELTDKDCVPDYETVDITHFTDHCQREDIINYLIRTNT